MKRKTFLSVFIWITFALSISSAEAIDSCDKLLPAALQKYVGRKNPGYRLPRQSDYSPIDVDYNLKHGGNECIGISKGSYFRKNVENYAFTITSKSVDHTILIVANNVDGIWKTVLLRDWGNSPIGGIYVETLAPGSFERTEALDGPISEPGEVMKLNTTTDGIISGGIESSGVVYAFDGTQWLHVWVSD